MSTPGAYNPKFRVVPFEDDEIAGVWVVRGGQELPCVAVYFNEQDGPVVGIHAAGCDGTHGLAAALSVQDGEGVLQLLGKDGQVAMLTAAKVNQLLAFIEGNTLMNR
jgi:hypothetical protein